MADTITVWVTEHDDPEVRFVINTRSDMEQNFADLTDLRNETVEIEVPWATEPMRFDPSRVIRLAPNVWREEFDRYCDGWTELDMPLDVWLSDDINAGRDWVEAELTRQA